MKFSFLILGAVLLSSSALKGATIYQLDTNPTVYQLYNNLTGTPVASSTNGQPLNTVGAAVAFTPTGSNYYLNSLEFTASLSGASSTNTIIAEVETDAGGLPSGTVLASFSISGQMGVFFTSAPVVLEAIPAVDSVILNQDSQYWIVLTETPIADDPTNLNTGDLVWNYNNSAPAPTYGLTAVWEYSNFDETYEWVSLGTTSYLAGGLLVTGTIAPTVPEPGTLLTLTAGLAAVFALKRKRA